MAISDGRDSSNLKRRSSLPVVAVVLSVVLGCDALSVDEPWSVHEQRQFYRSGADIPSMDGTRPGEYAIFIPQGVNRTALTLAAAESLVIGRDVAIVEPPAAHSALDVTIISSAGRLALGARTRVGAVYAMGQSPALFEDGVVVARYGKLAKPFQGAGPFNSAEIITNASGFVEEYRWNLEVPPPSPLPADVFAEGATHRRVLAPGSYESLTLPPGATIRLDPGTYFFDSLVISEGATLEINNAPGLVYVWVRRRLTIAGTMREYSLLPSTLFGYEGRDSPTISTAFQGTLVAPNAVISLPASARPHSGAFFGRAIQIADHASIEHRTFAGWEILFSDVGGLCGRCALVADASSRRCCATFDRTMSTQLVVSSSNRPLQSWDAYDALEGCLLQVVPTFIACAETSLMAADACDKLGYAYRAPRSCGSD